MPWFSNKLSKNNNENSKSQVFPYISGSPKNKFFLIGVEFQTIRYMEYYGRRFAPVIRTEHHRRLDAVVTYHLCYIMSLCGLTFTLADLEEIFNSFVVADEPNFTW